jgi:putative hydrolase of HD superfamily
MTDDTDHLVGYLHEAGHLKRTKRAGWWIAGVRDPESVAEHSFRTGIIAYVLAVMEGANPDRAAALALFHDMVETRIGDIPSTGRAHLRIASPQEVTKAQVANLPPHVASPIADLVAEFDGKETIEAMCAKDADKLECLLQAKEYKAAGYATVDPWADTMVGAVRTAAGKKLAEAALKSPVESWWWDIVVAYGTKQAPSIEPGDEAH